MEIKDLILLMWRNVRYIILGLVLGAGIGIVVSKIQAPVYEATAKVFVGRTSQQSNSDLLLLDDEQLLAINLQLAKFLPIPDDVSSQVDNIQIAAIPNTLIISIKVQGKDPQQTATIANLLVQTLIQQNETLLSERYAAFENAINEQVDQVQKQIVSLQTQISQINDTGIQEQLAQVNQQIEQLKTEISTLEQDIAGFPISPTPLQRISLSEKQAQLDQLHSLMNLYQQIQTNLTYIGKPGDNDSKLEDPRLTTLQSTLNLYQQMNITLINSREKAHLARTQSRQNVMQIVSATPSNNPILPMPVPYLLLGGAVGLVLAATAILMMDHFDDSLKSADQIEKLLGLPVLGFVIDRQRAKNKLITAYDPYSAEAEAFRALGANLEISGVGKSIRALMIVSAEPTDRKTTIAANLAIINAQQGKRVILLDGDLRHPHLHSLFGMENQKGFADLIHDRLDIQSALHAVKDIKGMSLISGGAVERDATGWLDAEKLTQLLSTLQQYAELVIVDGPPADVADAQILASKMNMVLLVIVSGHTHIDSAQATLRRFQLIGARVAGAVLNQTMNKQVLPLAKIKSHKEKEAPGIISEPDDAPISPS